MGKRKWEKKRNVDAYVVRRPFLPGQTLTSDSSVGWSLSLDICPPDLF